MHLITRGFITFFDELTGYNCSITMGKEVHFHDFKEGDRKMIGRIWHGWTTPANADAYEALLKSEIFVGIRDRTSPAIAVFSFFAATSAARSSLLPSCGSMIWMR